MNAEPRAAAVWLPSRFSLATFRLLGLVVARAKRGTRLVTMTILHMDEHQNPLEFYAVALAFLVIPTLHAWALIRDALSLSVLSALPMLLVLPFVVALAWDLLVFSVAALLWLAGRVVTITASRNMLQSLAAHAAMIAIAVASLAFHWPSRWLGAAWLALVAFNAVAWTILFLFRRPVQRFSDRVMGEA